VIGTYFPFYNTVCIFTGFKNPKPIPFHMQMGTQKMWNQSEMLDSKSKRKKLKEKNTPKIKSLVNIND